jgi:hypothetical protein
MTRDMYLELARVMMGYYAMTLPRYEDSPNAGFLIPYSLEMFPGKQSSNFPVEH